MKKTEKINIDFQVLPTRDPKVLSIADYSKWGIKENKPSIIEVIMPGEKEPVVNYFYKHEINIFNSINLNYNCPNGGCGDIDLIDLPDGIYEITVKGSPDSYRMSRKYLRTELIQLELDKLLISIDLMCKDKDKDLYNKIIDIDLLLRSAEANVRYDNICTAQELLFKAQELLEDSKNCSGCANATKK